MMTQSQNKIHFAMFTHCNELIQIVTSDKMIQRYNFFEDWIYTKNDFCIGEFAQVNAQDEASLQ